MNRMDRLDALLGDADELLDELDAEMIDDCLARGEAPDARTAEKCPWCRHDFHGLGCARPHAWGPATQYDAFSAIDTFASWTFEPGQARDWPCRCDSASTPLDDTWRPELPPGDTSYLMHLTGLDGWSVRALFDAALEKGRQRIGAGLCPCGCGGPSEWISVGEIDEVPIVQLTPARVSAGDLVVMGPGVVLMAPGGDVEQPGIVTSEPPPEPPAPRYARRVLTVSFDFNVRPEAFESFRRLLEANMPRVPTVRFREPRPDEPEQPETLQARALRLRQERNTGPARPTAQNARRPRRHE
jgi:hypothetical protein